MEEGSAAVRVSWLCPPEGMTGLLWRRLMAAVQDEGRTQPTESPEKAVGAAGSEEEEPATGQCPICDGRVGPATLVPCGACLNCVCEDCRRRIAETTPRSPCCPFCREPLTGLPPPPRLRRLPTPVRPAPAELRRSARLRSASRRRSATRRANRRSAASVRRRLRYSLRSAGRLG